MKKLIILSFLMFLSFIITASANGSNGGYGMGPGMMMWGQGMGWFFPIIMMAFWIAVIVGIIFLIRWVALSTDRRRETQSEDSALEILRNRYARGEINKEEFEEKKRDLGL
jgi:putative membrane protein